MVVSWQDNLADEAATEVTAERSEPDFQDFCNFWNGVKFFFHAWALVCPGTKNPIYFSLLFPTPEWHLTAPIGIEPDKSSALLQRGGPFSEEKDGDPNGIRTRVTAVKGRCPRPLDDRVKTEKERAAKGGWVQGIFATASVEGSRCQRTRLSLDRRRHNLDV